MAESDKELKNHLIRVKVESEKAGLKLNIKKKTKIIASGPIISWQIEREKVEEMTDFIFLGSKITADGDCSHEIKTLPPACHLTFVPLGSLMYSIWACTHTHTHTHTDSYEANNKIKLKSKQTKANHSNTLSPLLYGNLTEQSHSSFRYK